MATKQHAATCDPDTAYFADADLSILGSDRAAYLDYAGRIRREYRSYPDLLYKPGRKKVLKKLLALPAIFQTTWFRNLYEENARENMLHELRLLG